MIVDLHYIFPNNKIAFSKPEHFLHFFANIVFKNRQFSLFLCQHCFQNQTISLPTLCFQNWIIFLIASPTLTLYWQQLIYIWFCNPILHARMDNRIYAPKLGALLSYIHHLYILLFHVVAYFFAYKAFHTEMNDIVIYWLCVG